MSVRLSSGTRVTTGAYGPGTVISTTPKGVLVALDNFRGMQVLQQQTDLSPLGPVTPSPTSTDASQVRSRSIPEACYNARRSIEALRFGIVPMLNVRDLTLGFDELKAWVSNLLPLADGVHPHVSEICGPFGTGKSHTMAAIRYVATQEGYATASVEVDGNCVTLSNPATVLNALWKALAAKDFQSSSPLIEMNLKALTAGKTKAKTSLRQFDRVCSNLLTVSRLNAKSCLDDFAESMELLMAGSDEVKTASLQKEMLALITKNHGGWWGTETEISPKSLIGRLVVERPKDFVSCLVGYSVLSSLAGFKGLVVTIDEFEVERFPDWKTRSRLQNVVDALESWLSGAELDPGGPLGIFVATVDQDGHVGDEYMRKLVDSTGGEQFRLKNWPKKDRMVLAKRIYGLYSVAYQLEASFVPEAVDQIESGIEQSEIDSSGFIRSFIKRYVAHLDSVHGPAAA